MRLSVSRLDIGYTEDILGWKVYLDGVEQKYCVTADEERGEAWCYKLDDSGEILVVDDNEVLECKLGVVKLVEVL